MSIVLSWLVLSIAVWITAKILPGFEVRSFGGALAVAAIFGLLNWALGWLLFVLIGLGTLGVGFLLAFLTRWFVNAVLLKVTDAMSDSLRIKSFSTAFVGGLLMSGIGTLGQWLVHSAI